MNFDRYDVSGMTLFSCTIYEPQLWQENHWVWPVPFSPQRFTRYELQEDEFKSVPYIYILGELCYMQTERNIDV